MKISVIIPVYNVEKYIERCLDSILSQSFQDFEIVIVDDCTPDNSMDIIGRYSGQDSRIRIYRNPENLGLMWTRMIGYTNARGDYFVFCDSDDWLPQDALRILYKNAVKTDADIVAGAYQMALSGNSYGLVYPYTLSHGSDSEAVYSSLLEGGGITRSGGRSIRKHYLPIIPTTRSGTKRIQKTASYFIS